MPPSAVVLFNRLLARGKFRHIQVLLRLAELGSVQRTADAIGLTQSAVTQTLAYLERLLEMPLFERHARGVRPTAACQDLLPLARTLLAGLSDGADALSARAQRGQGSVRVAVSAAALNGMLLQALSGFASQHPDITVLLREAESDEQLLLAARGEVDLVACRRPAVIPEGWDFQPQCDDRYAILCSAKHPLAGQRVTWEALASTTWLPAPTDSPARCRFDALTAGRWVPRLHPVVTRSLSMMWWTLTYHDVLSFIPVSLARHLLTAGTLAEIRLDGPDDLSIAPLGLLLPLAAPTVAAKALSAFIEHQQQYTPAA